jgi:hypothetical protein
MKWVHEEFYRNKKTFRGKISMGCIVFADSIPGTRETLDPD